LPCLRTGQCDLRWEREGDGGDTPKILQRSSDAVAIIGSDDGVIDINEAIFAITGYSHDELVGSPCHDLFVRIGPLSCALVASRACRHWLSMPRSGARRSAPSATRDPLPEERRLAAQAKLMYLLQSRIRWPEVVMAALQTIGECFRWEFGALWLANLDSSTAQCSVVWRSQAADLAGLEVASRTMNPRLGAELIGRVWNQREAIWVPDVLREADFLRRRSVMRSAVHGWFAFPVREAASVVGAVEFFSQ